MSLFPDRQHFLGPPSPLSNASPTSPLPPPEFLTFDSPTSNSSGPTLHEYGSSLGISSHQSSRLASPVLLDLPSPGPGSPSSWAGTSSPLASPVLLDFSSPPGSPIAKSPHPVETKQDPSIRAFPEFVDQSPLVQPRASAKSDTSFFQPLPAVVASRDTHPTEQGTTHGPLLVTVTGVDDDVRTLAVPGLPLNPTPANGASSRPSLPTLLINTPPISRPTAELPLGSHSSSSVYVTKPPPPAVASYGPETSPLYSSIALDSEPATKKTSSSIPHSKQSPKDVHTTIEEPSNLRQDAPGVGRIGSLFAGVEPSAKTFPAGPRAQGLQTLKEDLVPKSERLKSAPGEAPNTVIPVLVVEPPDLGQAPVNFSTQTSDDDLETGVIVGMGFDPLFHQNTKLPLDGKVERAKDLLINQEDEQLSATTPPPGMDPEPFSAQSGIRPHVLDTTCSAFGAGSALVAQMQAPAQPYSLAPSVPGLDLAAPAPPITSGTKSGSVTSPKLSGLTMGCSPIHNTVLKTSNAEAASAYPPLYQPFAPLPLESSSPKQYKASSPKCSPIPATLHNPLVLPGTVSSGQKPHLDGISGSQQVLNNVRPETEELHEPRAETIHKHGQAGDKAGTIADTITQANSGTQPLELSQKLALKTQVQTKADHALGLSTFVADVQQSSQKWQSSSLSAQQLVHDLIVAVEEHITETYDTASQSVDECTESQPGTPLSSFVTPSSSPYFITDSLPSTSMPDPVTSPAGEPDPLNGQASNYFLGAQMPSGNLQSGAEGTTKGNASAPVKVAQENPEIVFASSQPTAQSLGLVKGLASKTKHIGDISSASDLKSSTATPILGSQGLDQEPKLGDSLTPRLIVSDVDVMENKVLSGECMTPATVEDESLSHLKSTLSQHSPVPVIPVCQQLISGSPGSKLPPPTANSVKVASHLPQARILDHEAIQPLGYGPFNPPGVLGESKVGFEGMSQAKVSTSATNKEGQGQINATMDQPVPKEFSGKEQILISKFSPNLSSSQPATEQGTQAQDEQLALNDSSVQVATIKGQDEVTGGVGASEVAQNAQGTELLSARPRTVGDDLESLIGGLADSGLSSSLDLTKGYPSSSSDLPAPLFREFPMGTGTRIKENQVPESCVKLLDPQNTSAMGPPGANLSPDAVTPVLSLPEANLASVLEPIPSHNPPNSSTEDHYLCADQLEDLGTSSMLESSIISHTESPPAFSSGTDQEIKNVHMDLSSPQAALVSLDLRHSPYPRTYALIVGIDEYGDPGVSKLPNPVADADDTYSLLTENAGVPKGHIINLRNGYASRAAIWDNLHLLASNCSAENDSILVYFTGHGAEVATPVGWPSKDNIIEIFLPYDFTPQQPHELGYSQNALTLDIALARKLQELVNRRGDSIRVILDLHHSKYSFCNTRGGATPSPRPINVGIANRSATLPKSFERAALNSHVLLASCSKGQTAKERQSGGEMAKELLQMLRDELEDELACIEPIKDARGRPSAEYPSHDEDCLTRADPQAEYPKPTPYMVKMAKPGHFTLQAGHDQGIVAETEFAVYTDQKMTEFVGTLKAQRPSDRVTPLKAVKGQAPFELAHLAFALPTKFGPIEHLRLLLSQDLEHATIVSSIKNKLKSLCTGEEKVCFVGGKGDQPDLILTFNDGVANFEIMDITCRKYGLTRIPLGLPTDPDKLAFVLHNATIFYRHLRPSNKLGIDTSKIRLSCQMVTKSDKFSKSLVLDPTSTDFSTDGQIVISTNQNQYGLSLMNSSGVGLYIGLFYFDMSDLSITPYYSGGPDAVLQHGSSLQIGYNQSKLAPVSFPHHAGQSTNVGFLKVCLAMKYVDYSGISQPSPFSQLEHQTSKTPPKTKLAHDSILIPVIQRM